MRRIILALILALFTLQPSLYAMHHAGGSSSVSDIYVGVEAGAAFFGGGSNPFIGKAYFGYREDIFSVEAAYFESAQGNDSNSTAWAKIRGGDLTFKVAPFANNGFEYFYIHAGGHYSQLKAGATSYTWGGSYTWSGKTDGVGWLAGAGLELPITESISARAGYSYYGALAGVKGLETDIITGGVHIKF